MSMTLLKKIPVLLKKSLIMQKIFVTTLFSMKENLLKNSQASTYSNRN